SGSRIRPRARSPRAASSPSSRRATLPCPPATTTSMALSLLASARAASAAGARRGRTILVPETNRGGGRGEPDGGQGSSVRGDVGQVPGPPLLAGAEGARRAGGRVRAGQAPELAAQQA